MVASVTVKPCHAVLFSFDTEDAHSSALGVFHVIRYIHVQYLVTYLQLTGIATLLHEHF